LTTTFVKKVRFLERLVRAGTRPPISDLVDLSFSGGLHYLFPEPPMTPCIFFTPVHSRECVWVNVAGLLTGCGIVDAWHVVPGEQTRWIYDVSK
jgi:hypothetical protein